MAFSRSNGLETQSLIVARVAKDDDFFLHFFFRSAALSYESDSLPRVLQHVAVVVVESGRSGITLLSQWF